jgi:hypothetical protein
LPESKSPTRFDCVAFSGDYEPLESLRNKEGKLFIYLTGIPEHFKAQAKRKADLLLSKTKSLSSIFIPDIQRPAGYGDIIGTQDGFIIEFQKNSENQIIGFNLFIARGQRSNRIGLYNLFCDQELNEEIESLKLCYSKHNQTSLFVTNND